MQKHTAFLSYAHTDNRDGSIGRLRQRLEDEATQSTGFDFEIFQDVEDIEPGERFRGRITEIIAAADFFIPIMSPSYFASEMCRMELEQFLKCERLAQGKKFLLPIYWRTSQELELVRQRTMPEGVDELARELASRQWSDWRKFRQAQEGDKMMRDHLRWFVQKIRKELWAKAPKSRKDGVSATYPTPTRTLVKIGLSGGRPCFVVYLGENGSLQEWDPWAPNERWPGRWDLRDRELSVQVGRYDLTASAQADGVYRGVEQGPYGSGDFIVVPTRHMNHMGAAEFPGTWVKVTESRVISLVEMDADTTFLEGEVGGGDGDGHRFGKWSLVPTVHSTFLTTSTKIEETTSQITAVSDRHSVWTGIETRNGVPYGRVLLAPVAEL